MAKTSIGKNFLYNVAYQILAMIIPLITSPYLARVLGVKNIGIDSWTYSVAFYFMIFATLGIGNYGNRTIASVRDSKKKTSEAFCNIYAIQLIMAFLVIVGYIIYIFFFSKRYHLIATLQGLYILSAAVDITWFFYGMEDFKVTVIRNSVVKVLGLCAVFLLVHTQEDLWKYTLISAGSVLGGQLVVWPFLVKQVDFVMPSIRSMKGHLPPIIVLFIPVLAISVFTNLDKLMIGKLSSVVESGYYANAEKIIGIPQSIITALGSVMLPRTANLIARGESKKSKDYISMTMVYVMFLASAFMFGMSGVADTFATVFWGVSFKRSGLLIACLTPAMFFSVFGNVIRTQYLIPRSKDREYTISLLFGAILNFLINLALIPRIGAMGGAIGTVVSELLMTALQSFFVVDQLPIVQYLIDGAGFFVIGLVMFGVIWPLQRVLNDSFISLLILIAVGATVYVGLSVIYMIRTSNKHVIALREQIFQQIKKRL